MKVLAPLVVGWSVALAGAAQTATPPSINLLLTPHSSDAAVDFFDVVLTIQSPNAKAGKAFLLTPETMPGQKDGPAFDPKSVTLHDHVGAVPFSIDGRRRIAPHRDTKGDVTLRYRAQTHPVSRDAFPPYDLRREGLTAVGAGKALIAAPIGDERYRLRVKWDLSHMPKGSIGVWSFGEGAVDRIGVAEDLTDSYYGAGPFFRYSKGPFGLYWASEPPFDAAALGKEAGALFDFYVSFFRENPDSFRAFLRKGQRGYSGAALTQSFLFEYDATKYSPKPTRQTLAHEMAHPFLGFWPGKRWYDEGMANHYAGVLGFRAGVISPEDFLESVNDDARMYYPLPTRNLPAAGTEVDDVMDDPAVDDLLYGRARIYFAHLNDLIRKKSAGARSLDDITIALIAQRGLGKPYDEEAWLALLAQELGPEGRQIHADFRAGKVFVPASDAFGPCFERVRTDVGAFDLGFDRKLLLSKPAIITGLRPGSPGEKAGLRDGDEIVASQVSKAYRDAKAQVVLQVRRGTETLDVAFVPRGIDQIDTYQWRRIATVPDAACKI